MSGMNARWIRRELLLVFSCPLIFLCASLTLRGEEVSFRNEVMAILSQAGCNAGGCHGNANGKGGFKLSLWGEDLDADFLALTREHAGRRINLLEPEQSLILLKATATLAHEGGQRFSPDSHQYHTLLEWIEQGSRKDPPDGPVLTRIEVAPLERILVEPEHTVSLQVRAFFSNGSERDISSLAVYEAATPLAEISPEGMVTLDGFGETTVLVRYLHCQTPVRLARIPARPDFVWNGPAPVNYIDDHIFEKLRRLRINPSEAGDDQVFIRRVYLDLLGLLPTAEEARQFIQDTSPDKRSRLVDDLLERPEFADFWALKWADLLRVEERLLDEKGVQRFHRWIRQSIAQGQPVDQFVREIIAARGSTYSNPPANFYRANRTTVSRAEAAAQVFLSTQLQCAQCHNHPFERWTQDDYYDWAALFSRVNYKILENRRQDNNDGHEFKGEQIVYLARQGEIKNPRTGQAALPRFLGAATPDLEGKDELEALAEWMASPDNHLFSRAQANRIWFHLMGRGIIDPIDDFRSLNPPSHPELIEALVRDFVESKFDLRHMIRVIALSRTYQLSSLPNETNAEDELNFSRGLIRRLAAEQVLDAQSQVMGVPLSFSGYPEGLRAVQLPGTLPERRRSRAPNELERFLEVFGKPPRLLTTECERSSEPTMAQAFQLISGPAVHQMISRDNNVLSQLLEKELSNQQMIEELYWSALTRAPSPTELQVALTLFETALERRAALEDLAWALLNAKEFLLRY